MLDIRLIRENPTKVQQLLDLKGKYNLQPILSLNEEYRQLEQERTALQTKSNSISTLVKTNIMSGQKANSTEIQALKAEGLDIKIQLNKLVPKEYEINTQITELLLTLPNLPSESTPIGKDERENIEIKRWGDEYIPTNPNILHHADIGEKLGLLEFKQAVKVAQARFVALKGAGAALERALIQFMLDRHINNGYVEVMPPLLVNSTSLKATGQLPKFAEDSFKCEGDDLWLIPTSEVSVINLYRDEILEAEQLPIYHCSYTPCFRREAGSYGRDTRG